MLQERCGILRSDSGGHDPSRQIGFPLPEGRSSVSDGFALQTNVVRQDGHRGVLVSVLKAGTASTLDVVAGIRKVLPRAALTLPPQLKITPLADQSLFVRSAIDGVVREAVIAAALTGVMINGRNAEKWELVLTMGGQTVTGHVWLDARWHFIVKEALGMGMTGELQNIKEGPQPASLFEVPADYHKMTMQDRFRNSPH